MSCIVKANYIYPPFPRPSTVRSLAAGIPAVSLSSCPCLHTRCITILTQQRAAFRQRYVVHTYYSTPGVSNLFETKCCVFVF